MGKLRLFVLLGGIAAILIAVGLVFLISYLNYQSYLSTLNFIIPLLHL